MDITKQFAVECAPGAEATCEWAMQETKRHDQFVKYRGLLVGAIIIDVVALLLIIGLVIRIKYQSKSIL